MVMYDVWSECIRVLCKVDKDDLISSLCSCVCVGIFSVMNVKLWMP